MDDEEVVLEKEEGYDELNQLLQEASDLKNEVEENSQLKKMSRNNNMDAEKLVTEDAMNVVLEEPQDYDSLEIVLMDETEFSLEEVNSQQFRSPPHQESTVISQQGSELEKLLLSVRGDIETFPPNSSGQLCSGQKTESTDPPPLRNNRASEKVVLAELIRLKHLLLSCGLMLDEDISFLVNEYPDHQEITYLRRLDRILLPGCCLTLMISSYRLVKNLKWSILLFLSSIGPTVFIAYKLFQVSRVKNRMEELLLEMKSLTRFVKKTTKSIKETMTVVNTRLILSSFRKMNPALMDRYYLQLKVDIDYNSHTFMKFLLEIISITREATKLIISTEAFTNCSKSFFLASCTNEELGLPTLNDDSAVGISITKLEELSIEYLVMQSEYLRALGMWLCSTVHTSPDEVSSKILIYRENISRKHKMAQTIFTGALFTRYLERTNLPMHGSTDIVVSKLNSALMALIIEGLCLKSCLNEIELGDISCFEFGLSNLESCISDCTEIFKEVRSYSRRRICDENDQECSKFPSGPENSSSVRKTGVEVGYTDFSVSGEDKVYLCITDANESMENLNDDSMLMDESLKYPQTLLHELRSVLEEKRIEFRQRESNAIKNSDLESFENQFDLVLLNKPMEEGVEQPPVEQVKSQSKSDQKLPSVRHQKLEDSHLLSNVSDFSLSKSIAATAAKTSATWNCQNEEFFGDDDNDDNESINSE